ncbi:hypothetical protein [Loktanella atrilutea]|uniref:hypothetical protein n=1 Tax=Loktanella atrilutea TaxID=366533 RepID=UPI0015B4CD25|nr:hypothetical protein [Loktanella atrilutea]
MAGTGLATDAAQAAGKTQDPSMRQTDARGLALQGLWRKLADACGDGVATQFTLSS